MPAGPRPEPPVRSCRVTFEGLYESAPWANVVWLHLNGSGEITNETLHAMCDTLYGTYSDTLLVPQSNASTLERVVALLFSGDGEQVAFSSPASVVGSQGGLGLPANVACCISWPIAVHYRGGHPRTYLSGIPASAISNNTTFDSDYVAIVAADAQDFHTGLEALSGLDGITSVEHGAMSFVSGGEWRTPPVFRRIADGAHVDSRIDSQRRRLGRDRA